jgi:hypothetical protein
MTLRASALPQGEPFLCYCGGSVGGEAMAYSYRCKDYPGNEACPAAFTAATPAEVMKHVELHGEIAHGEDPSQWSPKDRQQVKELIRNS